MESSVRTTPLTKAFDSSGWHLERAILDQDAVERVRTFLEQRRLALVDAFEAWSGESARSLEAYAAHQQRLPEYEERGLPKDLYHFLRGEFDLATRLDLILLELMATDRVRTFVATFLDSDAYLIHYPPMVRFKTFDAQSSLVPPHQDWAYNEHLTNFVTVWVPLVDIDDECGGVIVYPGTHLDEAIEHHGEGAWSAKALVNPTLVKTHVHMQAGDALLFPPRLLHESAPHRSRDLIRYSIDFRVFRNTSDTTKSFYDPATKQITRAS